MRSIRLVRAFALMACVVVGAACTEAEDPETQELPDEVSVVIGKEGGTVRAKGVTLEIPAGALDKQVTITAKKAKDQKVQAGVKPVSDVYEFGPKGTTFQKDVKLSIGTTKQEPQAKVYFTKKGSETVFEKLDSTSQDKKVAAQIKHFSLGFAGLPEDDEPGLDGSVAPSDAGTEPSDASDSEPDAAVDQPDASTQLRRIVVTSRDEHNVPAAQTWVAVQDGDGPWQVQATPASTGVYAFDIASERFGVALVCTGEGLASSGQAIFALSTSTQHQVTTSSYCTTSPAPTHYQITGTLELPVGAQSFIYGHPYAYGSTLLDANPTTSTPYAILDIPENTPVQPIIAVADANGIWLKADVLHALTLTADRTIALDLADGGVPVSSSNLTVLGGGLDTFIEVHFTTGLSTRGLPMQFGPISGSTSRAQSFRTFPSGSLNSTDRYRYYASDGANSVFREVEHLTASADNPTLTLPASIAPTFGTEAGSYLRPAVVFADVPGATEYKLDFEYTDLEDIPHLFEVRLSAEFFSTTTGPRSASLPDFSGLSGFDSSWVPPTDASLTVRAGSTSLITTGTDVLRTYSERSGYLTVNP